VKGAQKRGAHRLVGYDAARKIKGWAVDTLAWCSASPSGERAGRRSDSALLKDARRLFPFLGARLSMAAIRELAPLPRSNAARVPLRVVKRSDNVRCFVVLTEPRIVERIFGWLGRWRRLAKDFENPGPLASAFV
jgi:hypothetical protein